MKTLFPKVVFSSLILSISSSVVLAAPKWVQMPSWKAGANGPSDREHPLFFITPEKPDEAILYGGLDFSNPQQSLNDLWALNLKNGKWRRLNQQGVSPSPGARLAISGKRKEILVTGGKTADGLPASAAFHFSVHKNVGKWETVANPGLARSYHSLSAIPGTNFFLSFGGIGVDASGSQTYSSDFSLVELRSQDGRKVLAETLLSDPNTPSGRYGFVSAYDQRNSRLIVTVGQGPMGLNEKGELTSEQDNRTYALNVSENGETNWQELKSAKLGPRRNPCWAHDRNRNHLYVWGGTTDGVESVPGLFRLNLNEAEPRWESVLLDQKSETPKARSSCVGIYDEHRNRILFGFGNNLNEQKTAIAPETNIWALEL